MFEFTLFFFPFGIAFWDYLLALLLALALALALALPLHDRWYGRTHAACVDGCRHFSGPSKKKLKKARIPYLTLQECPLDRPGCKYR